jgi:two-component system invasion response regulator UvrY
MKILIVDDHALVRAGTRLILQGICDDALFDDAEKGNEALQKVRERDYDVVILDLALGDISGFEVLAGIRREKPRLPVIVVSMHLEEAYAVKAYAWGADGFIGKRSAPAELIHAVKKVVSGGTYISEQLMGAVIAGLRHDSPMEVIPPKAKSLSKREGEVAELLVSGASNKEIAWHLSLSVKTVSTYKLRILGKLNLKNLAELVKYAVADSNPYPGGSFLLR